jgi:outer membrane protein
MLNDKLARPAPPRSPASGLARAARVLRRGAAPIVAAALIGAALLSSAPAEAQQAKIAVIDVRRAVLETEEGLRVQAKLKKLFDSRQVELDAKQRALAEEQHKLEKEAQANKTPKEALQRKSEALQRQSAEFQSTYVDYQREMQRTQDELTTPILQRVLGIVRRIASQEGYEMIVEKSAVPYFRADLEVTDRVIQMYNSGQPGDPAGKSAPPGAAPAGEKPQAAPPPKAAPPQAPKKK